MGRELLDLHVGFESAEPYPLERVEKSSLPKPSSVRETTAPAGYAATGRGLSSPSPSTGESWGEGAPPTPLSLDGRGPG